MSAAHLTAEELLTQRLQEQRKFWVPLDPARPDAERVQLIRPVETEMHRLVVGVTAQDIVAHTVAWDGFTEATFLGQAVGASDPLAYSRALWLEGLGDNAKWFITCAESLKAAIHAFFASRASTQKNEGPARRGGGARAAGQKQPARSKRAA